MTNHEKQMVLLTDAVEALARATELMHGELKLLRGETEKRWDQQSVRVSVMPSDGTRTGG